MTTADYPPLEKLCPQCRGKGVYGKPSLANLPNDCSPPCVECNGTGFQPTLFGLDVFTFLARHQKHLRQLFFAEAAK